LIRRTGSDIFTDVRLHPYRQEKGDSQNALRGEKTRGEWKELPNIHLD
jgi:hypothetical protein